MGYPLRWEFEYTSKTQKEILIQHRQNRAMQELLYKSKAIVYLILYPFIDHEQFWKIQIWYAKHRFTKLGSLPFIPQRRPILSRSPMDPQADYNNL